MFSTIHGTVGVLYYKIGTIHSALSFSSVLIIENTNGPYCASTNIDPKPGMSHYIPCLITE
jgi:hypothetical protein